MIKPGTGIVVAFFLIAMMLSSLTPAQAAGGCPAIEAVQWWQATDHARMTTYVDARHGGDWDAYIKKWQSHLAAMQAIHSRGGAVVSKQRGMTIKGRDLYDYIRAIENRLSVTRCLAELEMAKAAKILEGLETASGGNGGTNKLPETVK